MAQVPYQKVPEVSPVSQQIPAVNVNAPPAAFGLNIAEATKAFGAQAEHSGNEIFQEGMRIKQLENESWAKDQDVNVMMKISEATEKFKELEGGNAAAGLNAHIESIKAMRKQALDGAPNPNARRLLDNDLIRRVGFAIVDAGAHAGNQAKAANRRAGLARQGAAEDDADPSNPEQYSHDLEVAQREVERRGIEAGDRPETIARDKALSQDKMITRGLEKMAPRDPEKAKAFLQENEGRLVSEKSRDNAWNIVNRNMALHQTNIDASDIMKGKYGAPAFDPAKGPGQDSKILEAAQKVADEKGEGNPDYEKNLMSRVRGMLSLGHQAYADTQAGNRQDIEQFVRGPDPTKNITSIDGVAGPNAPQDIRDKYWSLSPENREKVRAFIEKANRAAKKTETRETLAEYHQLYGMAKLHPEEFVQESLIDKNLTDAKFNELMKLQIDTLARKTDNTATSQFLRDANPILRSVGIVPGEPKSKESRQYLHFVGALDHKMRDWQEANPGKKPQSEDIRKATGELVKEFITEPGTFFDTKRRSFEIEVPDAEKPVITKALRNLGELKEGQEPSETQLQAAYIRIHKLKEVPVKK